MYLVEPDLPWEVPIQSSVLVASAMARARPAAMEAEPPRLNGLPNDVVAKRYTELIRLWTALPDVKPTDLTDMERLEGLPGTTGFPPWETVVMRTGADDDASVVAAARSVWEHWGRTSTPFTCGLDRIQTGASRQHVPGWVWVL